MEKKNLTFDRDKLIVDLRQGVVDVTFQNGETLKCTLDPRYMPPKTDRKDIDASIRDTEAHIDEGRINAWCLARNKWVRFTDSDVVYVQFHTTF